MSSRIQKSIANAKVNVIFYVFNIFLAFFSRKIFLVHLGTEFLGLTGTLGDIFNIMNITELGIGTAVGVTLYKPLYAENRESINDIISVFGYLYSKVGKIIACVGIGISILFPLIFGKAAISIWLIYLMFFSMLYGSLIGYFVNYRQIILSASQKNYVIAWRYNTAVSIKIIAQIGVSLLPYNYIWWILMEFITVSVYSLILNRAIKKHFPWLKTSITEGKRKFKEYKYLWTKTKQVFVLKLSHIIFTGSINIFISIFASISSVALYGNYNMIMFKITGFIDSIFTGMEASVGNLIAEGNMQRIFTVFFELLCIRYFLASLCSISLFFIVPRIIIIWLGSQYILPTLLLSLMSIHIFIQQARLTVDNFKNGYGLYQDVWAPIAEVVMCVIGASIFGYLYKLPGILCGFIIGELLIKMIWKPYYLFKKGFNCSVSKLYWPKVAKYLVICGLTLVIVFFVHSRSTKVLMSESWLGTILYCSVIGLSTFFSLTMMYWLTDNSFKGFVRHMLQYRLFNK